jgi:hypothetical protein
MALLRRNHPSHGDDFGYIDLSSNEISVEEWSEALSRDKYVTTICVHLPGMIERNWDSLLRAISTRDILENVTLSMQTNCPKLVARFLRSIQLNPAIHSIILSRVQVSGTVLAGFLDAATSVTDLCIHGCEMEEAERDQGVIDVAASIQRNTRIRKLRLTLLDGVYLCPILSSLASNSHVRKLEIGLFHYSSMNSPRREAPDSVKHLLESTASIETFVLTDFNCGEENFLPIAQGLINSEPVTDIEFWDCDFRGSGLHFKSILQSKPNIRSLLCGLLSIFGKRTFRRELHPSLAIF